MIEVSVTVAKAVFVILYLGGDQLAPCPFCRHKRFRCAVYRRKGKNYAAFFHTVVFPRSVLARRKYFFQPAVMEKQPPFLIVYYRYHYLTSFPKIKNLCYSFLSRRSCVPFPITRGGGKIKSFLHKAVAFPRGKVMAVIGKRLYP